LSKSKKGQAEGKVSKDQRRKPSRKKKVLKEIEKGAAEAEEEVVKVEREIKKEAELVEKAVKGKIERPKEPSRPSGMVPRAMVVARHGTGTVKRRGRGFSLGELLRVGLAARLATKWGVRIDYRRRSVLDGNVSSLKAWRAPARIEARVEGEGKNLEEELEKAGREVEKEAVAVEKEVVKVAKEVKKEAKKVERVVKKKVEKSKGRPKKQKAS
jgi:ribosomal protein L13E